MRKTLVGLVVGLLPLANVATVDAAVLYDGALGTLPAGQGWIYLTDPLFGAAATQALLAGTTVLDTTPVRTDKAGYFSRVVRPPFPPLGHPSMPVLDRAVGFRVAFEVRIATELHVSADRAGFSLIVLSSDLWGLEIGFWMDEIWVQADDPLFTHAEGVAFDTTSGLTRYELCVDGDDYSLSANGVPILSGLLRDYSAFGSPYSDHRDFVFLGDDTSSASATIELGWVEAGPAGAALALGNSLRVARAGTNLRFELPSLPGATQYRLYRDLSKLELGVTPFDAVPSPPFFDSTSLSEADSYYFVGRVADGCGFEYEIAAGARDGLAAPAELPARPSDSE